MLDDASDDVDGVATNGAAVVGKAEADGVEVLTEEEVESRGSCTVAVATTKGASSVNTRSSSLQQLVLRPVIPDPSVP